MLKVVFDTNVFISAIICGGTPRTCMNTVIHGRAKLFVSPAILAELETVLSRERFGFDAIQLRLMIAEIEGISTSVEVTERVVDACRDKKDHIILECALAAGADCIVTGDKDLLVLDGYQGLSIISCAEFARIS